MENYYNSTVLFIALYTKTWYTYRVNPGQGSQIG